MYCTCKKIMLNLLNIDKESGSAFSVLVLSLLKSCVHLCITIIIKMMYLIDGDINSGIQLIY